MKFITEISKYLKHNIKILKKYGFNPILISPSIMLEETYIFESQEEADRAYQYFEQDKKLIFGWWYGFNDFVDNVIPWYYNELKKHNINDEQINLYMIDIEKLRERLTAIKNNVEFEQQFLESLQIVYRKEKIQTEQRKRFHEKCQNDPNYFEQFITKVIAKYESKEYREKWYKQSCEPKEYLFEFLYDYAIKYGEYDEENEYFKIYDYSLELICGQGCYYVVQKIK